MPHQMLARNSLFVILIIQALLPSTTIAETYASVIPEPNICSPGSGNFALRSWLSTDCPRSARCIPVSTTNISSHWSCSCGHSDSCFKVSNQRCVATKQTYIVSAMWILLIAVAIFLAMLFVLNLIYAIRHNTFRFDTLMVAFICAWLSLVMFAIHALLFVITILGDLHDATYTIIVQIRVAFIGAQGICVLAALMVFGVALHFIVLSSFKLQSLDIKRMKRHILIVAVLTTSAMLVFVIPMLLRAQLALSTCGFGFFGLVSWILFGFVLSRVSLLTRESAEMGVHVELTSVATTTTTTTTTTTNSATNLRSVSSNSQQSKQTSTEQHLQPPQHLLPPPSPRGLHSLFFPSPPPNPSRIHAHHNATLLQMQALSSRVTIIISAFLFVSVIAIIIWFVGRNTANETLLGVDMAATYLVNYAIVLWGIASMWVFMRNIIALREQQANVLAMSMTTVTLRKAAKHISEGWKRISHRMQSVAMPNTDHLQQHQQ